MKANWSFCRLTLILLSLAVSGCSTWRCRGFIERQDKAVSEHKGDYVIESIEFRKLGSGDRELIKRNPTLQWLAQNDAFEGTSYREDIAAAAGLTNNASVKPIKIHVSIVPLNEHRTGASTVWWPLAGTLGVFPAHVAQEMPFDVIVQFESDLPEYPGRSPYHYAEASIALICSDRQFGLTRMDMDTPPPAVSAATEYRDDGTVGTGRHLRQQRLRGAFIQTVAAAVLDEIAVREGLKRDPIPPAATEFGLVSFSSPDVEERKLTPGWGQPPSPKLIPSLDEYLERAWQYSQDDYEKRMKSLVVKKIITKQEWRASLTKHYSEIYHKER